MEQGKTERFSFESESDDAQEQQKRRGAVKLDGSKSKFAKEAAQKEQFEQQADEAMATAQDKRQRAVDLVRQFWNIAKSTTIETEKGPIERSLEKETVSKLVEFAAELNNDPNESSDGTGSIAVITLLLKTVLHLRDNNNTLRYKLSVIENKVNKLSSTSGKTDAK